MTYVIFKCLCPFRPSFSTGKLNMDITVSTGLINTLYYYEVVNIRETPLGYIY